MEGCVWKFISGLWVASSTSPLMIEGLGVSQKSAGTQHLVSCERDGSQSSSSEFEKIAQVVMWQVHSFTVNLSIKLTFLLWVDAYYLINSLYPTRNYSRPLIIPHQVSQDDLSHRLFKKVRSLTGNTALQTGSNLRPLQPQTQPTFDLISKLIQHQTKQH